MQFKPKSRRGHSDQLKAQVVAACGEPGASVSAVALSFGLNANLVRQWLRGRGYSPQATSEAVSQAQAQPQFVALPLPPLAAKLAEVAAPVAHAAPQAIRVELKRGALAVSVTWPLEASGQCAAWLAELLG